MNWIGQIGWCLVIVPCSKLDSKLRGKSGTSGEPYILLYKYIISTETTKQGRDFLKTDEDVRCTAQLGATPKEGLDFAYYDSPNCKVHIVLSDRSRKKERE